MQNRRNGRQLILIGVVVIVLVLGVGFFLMNRGGGAHTSANPAAPNGLAPVVVAQQVIPQGTVFKSGQNLKTLFVVRQEPVGLVPFGAYTSVIQIEGLTRAQGCGPVQAAGCQGQITTSQTIFQNTPVITGMFSTLGQYRQAVGPAFAIPYGYVGVSVNFDAVNSVLGSISAGDDVDVIASYRGTHIAGVRAPAQTQYVMNDVRVMSVNAPPAPTSAGGSTSTSSSTSTSPPPNSANAGGTLILLVRFQQALVVQHLKDFGWQISVVLRSASETDIPHFKTLPVTDKWFFAKSDNPLKSNPGY
jgi:Flp pilus assembly protein CpaB